MVRSIDIGNYVGGLSSTREGNELLERIREFGSDFHICLEEPYYHNNAGADFTSKNISFHLSGRAALAALLMEGIRKFGWHSVYFPSYYCHEVVAFIKSIGIDVHYYSFNPFLDDDSREIEVNDEEGNVIINVLFFGVRKANVSGFRKAAIVDDVTHRLTEYENSPAQYCFGSLRKELPLPCGGFCFPAVEDETHRQSSRSSDEIAYQRVAAMMLKREYLDGHIVEKKSYRHLFKQSEDKFLNERCLGVPGIVLSMLENLNMNAIELVRTKNLALLQSLIDCDIYFRDENSSGLFLKFNTADERDHMRTNLLQKNIYPAILWPSQENGRDRAIQERVLFIHTDYRYNSDDMQYLAGVLNRYRSNG